MRIHLATHFGMCFGVRDAIEATKQLAAEYPTTVLGELVHNPIVNADLASLGVHRGKLDNTRPAPTPHVVITAHGASDRDRHHWKSLGHQVTDTTCPLVHRAHRTLATLVATGHHPIVVGQPGHAEVLGLVGDFPEATIVETPNDISNIPSVDKLGIVAQTTQPIEHVVRIVELIESNFPTSLIEFRDTVCQPTKNRQQALLDLCAFCDLIIVVGGANSNNTRQLVLRARSLGLSAYQIQTPQDLDPAWFTSVNDIGITAGTSTMVQTVHAVRDAILNISNPSRSPGPPTTTTC